MSKPAGRDRIAQPSRRAYRILGTILLTGLACYAAAGIVTAIAFVIFGVTRVLDHPVAVTTGARILFVPAAFALWPYVLHRWLKAGHHA